MNRPIPISYWVVDELLLAGEYAGAVDPERARRKLDALLDAGICAFFDLTEDGELPAIRGHGAGLGSGSWPLDYIRTGADPRRWVPRPTDLQGLLSRLQAHVDGGIPSYVHCWGGIGRTGTVVGCWLVQGGMDDEAALTRIEEFRSGTPDAGRRSPETAAQVALVRDWVRIRNTLTDLGSEGR